MKVFFTIVLTCISTFGFSQFLIGPHVALPAFDSQKYREVIWGVDVYYYLGKETNSIKVGAMTGFTSYSGGNITSRYSSSKREADNYIPVAGSMQVKISSVVKVAADLGYAGGTGNTNSGFFWRSVLRYEMSDLLTGNFFYQSVKDDEENLAAFGVSLFFKIRP